MGTKQPLLNTYGNGVAKMNKERFATAILVLGEAYRQKVTDLTVRAYELVLSDLPVDVVEAACAKAMRVSKYFPSAYELREFAGVIPEKTRAAIAWESVESAVRIHGGYTTVLFDDPVVNAVIRNLGGWIHVCSLSIEEFNKWFRKDFESRYESFFQAQRGIMEPLIGLHEKQNRGTGEPFDHCPRKLIATKLPVHEAGPLKALQIRFQEKRKQITDRRSS